MVVVVVMMMMVLMIEACYKERALDGRALQRRAFDRRALDNEPSLRARPGIANGTTALRHLVLPPTARYGG